MPKVTRKESAAAPLREVPSTAGMEIEAGEELLPPKPSFGALSAQHQTGAKVEFRRVSWWCARRAAVPCAWRPPLPGVHRCLASTAAWRPPLPGVHRCGCHLAIKAQWMPRP